MNRIELRTYYRKCTGMLTLAGAALMFVAACFAILLPFDIAELQAEEGNGLVALNCMYVVFALGMVFALMMLVVGIVALASQSEGVFTFARTMSVLDAAVMILSTVISIYVVTNKEVSWDTEHRVWAWIYLVTSFLAVVYSVVTFIFANTGLKYYDRAKKLAKDIPDMKAERPAAMKAGVAMVSASVFVFAVTMMSYYFSNMIKHSDEIRVENNRVFSTMYFVLFVVGMCVVIDTAVIGIVNVVKENCPVYRYSYLVFIENMIYVLLFVVVSLVALSQPFAQEGYFLMSEVVFTFALCACVAGYAAGNLKAAWKARIRKEHC